MLSWIVHSVMQLVNLIRNIKSGKWFGCKWFGFWTEGQSSYPNDWRYVSRLLSPTVLRCCAGDSQTLLDSSGQLERHGRREGWAAPGPDSCTSLSCFGQGPAEEGQSSPWRRQSSRPHCLHCQRHWRHPCHGPSCASWERRGGCRTCHSPWSCTCRACHLCEHESVSCGRLSLQTSYRTHQTHTWRASLLENKNFISLKTFSSFHMLPAFSIEYCGTFHVIKSFTLLLKPNKKLFL